MRNNYFDRSEVIKNISDISEKIDEEVNKSNDDKNHEELLKLTNKMLFQGLKLSIWNK